MAGGLHGHGGPCLLYTSYSLKVVGECDPDKTGTKVTFLPDGEIFEETVFEYDVLKLSLIHI